MPRLNTSNTSNLIKLLNAAVCTPSISENDLNAIRRCLPIEPKPEGYCVIHHVKMTDGTIHDIELEWDDERDATAENMLMAICESQQAEEVGGINMDDIEHVSHTVRFANGNQPAWPFFLTGQLN